MNNNFHEIFKLVNQTNWLNVSEGNNLTQYNLTLNISTLRHILQDHFFDTRIDNKTIILLTIYIPIFLLGILGNGAVLFIVCNRRQLRNITNLFLWNLALADIAGMLLISQSMPLSHKWDLGKECRPRSDAAERGI